MKPKADTNIAKILIVDDKPENLIAMEMSLEDLEAELFTTESGQQALQLMLEHEFALVLLDVQMPIMDGFETAELMKKNIHTRQIPIIFVTAISKEEKHVFKGYEVGAVDYLFKPIDPEILRSKVQVFLDIYSSNSEKMVDTVNELRLARRTLRMQNEELSHLALHDPLTSLANRHEFEEQLIKIIAHSTSHREKFAVLLLDLDNFKSINDNLGHQIGDELLKHISKLLQANLRKDDFVARLGGDEFAIIANNITDYSDASKIAGLISKIANKPLNIQGNKITTSFSVGVACFPFAGNEASDLVRNSDIAMYKAKAQGKNQICYFTEEMQHHFLDTVKIEVALRDAITNNKLALLFQPIYQLDKHQPIGIEILIDWSKLGFENTTHKQFTSIAEKIGIIEDIEGWLFSQAFKHIDTWSKQSLTHCYYSINLSPSFFQHSRRQNRINNDLMQYQFDHSLLAVNISEDILAEQSQELMDMLKSTGIKLILNNFGAGQSSFMHLVDYPIQAIKIHAPPPDNIDKNLKSEKIIKSIISVAEHMDFDMIVDQVETAEQKEFLQKNKCLYAQGNYLHEPCDAENITKLFESYHE